MSLKSRIKRLERGMDDNKVPTHYMSNCATFTGEKAPPPEKPRVLWSSEDFRVVVSGEWYTDTNATNALQWEATRKWNEEYKSGSNPKPRYPTGSVYGLRREYLLEASTTDAVGVKSWRRASHLPLSAAIDMLLSPIPT